MKKYSVGISPGHNPDGEVACGAVGIIKESTQNRKLLKLILKRNEEKKKLKIHDCTPHIIAESAVDYLERCCKWHNSYKSDVNIQIHFNSFNGKSNGCEILVVENTPQITPIMTGILNELESIGFQNRGIKLRDNLYFLNHCKNAMIIEVCFCDNADDVKLYRKNKQKIANKIYKAIVSGLKYVHRNDGDK